MDDVFALKHMEEEVKGEEEGFVSCFYASGKVAMEESCDGGKLRKWWEKYEVEKYKDFIRVVVHE